MRAGGVHVVQIQRDDEIFLLIDTRFGKNFSRRSRDKTLPPEFNALAADIVKDFVADTVGHADVATVGDGVAALYCLPRIVLERAVFLFLAGMPADGRGIKKNLGPLQRGQAR